MIHHHKYLSTTASRSTLPYLSRDSAKNDSLLLNLALGKPNPDIFPFKEAVFTKTSGEVLHLPQHLLDVAFQYAPSSGIPELFELLRDMVVKMFAPPHMDDRGVFITAGANLSNYIILHTFVDDGDYVFLPEHTSPNFLSALKTTNANAVTVPNDCHGLDPCRLEAALKNSPAQRRKLLYLVPNGDNPTGVTLTHERRREIYSLACQYDILIMEDDPYYCMQYGSEIPPTFLSLDIEGRVLRIDSFAKTMGAGMRIGYMTADLPFIEALVKLQSSIMDNAPTLSQVVVNELLQSWGIEGFLQKTKHIADMYKQKRDMALAAASKYLSGLCEWNEPDGMFLWLKVRGVEDVREMVEKKCLHKNLAVIPGNECMLDNTQPCPYIRTSFSLATPEILEKGFQILADVIRDEMKITNKVKEKL